VLRSDCSYNIALRVKFSYEKYNCHNNILLPRHEVSQHGFVKERYNAGRERDMLGFFHCRASCGLVFSTKDIRNK